MCVPSSFFIGDNGIPLEVIAGSVSAEELIARIHKVKQVKQFWMGFFFSKVKDCLKKKLCQNYAKNYVKDVKYIINNKSILYWSTLSAVAIER